MNTIAIETSSSVGSVACVAHGRPIHERNFTKGLVHGRELLVELDKCMREVDWKRSDIELVAVSVGPGSYTGLRVGVAAAKALAYALRVQVIAVPSLDVIAENGPKTADHVAVAVDARREQVYASFYTNVAFSFFREDGPLVLSPQEFAERLEHPVYVLGDALTKYSDAIVGQGVEAMGEITWRPQATNVGLLGEKAFLIGERTDPLKLSPLYLRLPEAEEKWRAGKSGGKSAL